MKKLYSVIAMLIMIGCSPNYNPSNFTANGVYQSTGGDVFLLNPLEDLQ
jgi:hypothetical protein